MLYFTFEKQQGLCLPVDQSDSCPQMMGQLRCAAKEGFAAFAQVAMIA